MASVLRYPYDLYTQQTDYLQITLLEKKSADTIDSGVSAFTTENLIKSPGFAQSSQKGANVSQTQRPTRALAKVGGIILLPIPSNISDSNSVNFSEDKLDAITATVAAGAYDMMNTTVTGGSVQSALEKLGTAATKTIGEVVGAGLGEIYLRKLAAEAGGLAGVGNISLDQILARSEGKILNPNMELLFNGPTIRSFKFSFKMTPRSQKEAEQVKFIIGSLKRHMAPVPAGTFLGTPGQFELRYRTGAEDHNFLNKFKKCVLKDMSVNYTGENVYATYGDGTPVSMIMDLTFQELEPIYSTDYSDSDRGVGY